MQIIETKKIELTPEEFQDVIRKGLGISNKSEFKFSFKLPNTIKLTIISKTDGESLQVTPPLKTIDQLQPGHEETPVPQNIPTNIKVCNNCSYPYPYGDDLFCDVVGRVVKKINKCESFEPKIIEKDIKR